MARSDNIILVTGGTGHQGGAAARHLLEDGWRVRALVRDPAKPAAVALGAAGAELVVGDLLEPGTLNPAVEGAYGVYSVETPPPSGIEGEVAEGVNLANAAHAAGVEHFVFSSVRGADDPGGVAYVVPKHRIETHIRAIGLPATIWRPVTFMENFIRQRDEIRSGRLTGPAPADAMKQMIAVDDIGRFVALAFSDPDRFVGVTMEIASDEMTWSEVAATFGHVLGREVRYETVGTGWPVPPSTRTADLDALRMLLPGLQTFEHWVEALGWT